jgi:hypothetical protein
MLQVLHQQARLGGAGRGGPLGRSGPRMRAGSQAGTTTDAEYKAISMGVVAGVEHEAASMLGCSLSLLIQLDAASQHHHHAPAAACGQQECAARRGPSLLLLMAAVR